MNILITCAGRRHYLVEFFKDFVGKNGKIIGTDMSPYAPALAACDIVHLCHAVTHPAYIEQLIEICIDQKIDYIFSVNDLELALLSKNKEKIEKSSGATVVISEEAVINIASDKYLTYKFFEQHKILAPKTYISVADTIEALSTGEISFPLMIKPRWGSASISLLKINTLEELRPAYLACSEAIKNSILNSLGDSDSVIIQEFIEGQEYGLDILNSLDSEHIGFCAKKKLAMRAGETDKATPIDGRRFEDSAKKISKHLRHIGNLDCDVLEKNGALYYLELNPRFGGGYPFTHLAGANHIELLLSTDDNTLKSEKYSYTTDYTLSKCDTIVKFKIK